MRSDIIRTYKTVHTWTGILTGLFLFVAFYAGALTVFETPLQRWSSPPPKVEVTPLEQAAELIALTITVRPEARREFTLHLGDGAEIPARLTWQKSREDREPLSAALDEDGGLRVTRLFPAGLAQFVDDLHRTGGLPLEVELGAAFMGIVSGLYVLALVSGLIILLPSLVKDLFALRIGANLKRMWLDAHNLIGLFSLPFHLIIGLSAVVFGLHDEIYGVLDRVVYEGNLPKVMRASSPMPASRDRSPAGMLAPQDILARLHAVEPGFKPYAMDYVNAGTAAAAVRVWGKDERFLMRGQGFAVLSPVTGEVLNTDYMPGHQGAYGAIVASFFALHFGSFGGEPVKWGYLALGLSGAFLFYSGNLLWVESRRRTERRAGGPVGQGRNTRWMAALTVAACLGSVAGLSAAMVASKWLNGRVADLDLWLRLVHFAVLLLSLAWAFALGAGRAAPHLLLLAALCTLAIPATSAAALALPGLGLWAWHGAWGVDAVALAASLLLIRMALAARRRALSGPRDSVWSRRPMSDPVPVSSV